MTAAESEPSRNPRSPDDWRVQPAPQVGSYPVPGYQDPSAFASNEPGNFQYGPPIRSGTNTMAVASLVSSIVGFAPYFGGILSIVGIVLGSVALNQIKQAPQDGYGLAVSGIVVGVATLIIGLIWTIYAMR